MAQSRNHKAVWKPASETREQRRERLTARREQQHSLKTGVLKSNLLWSSAIDAQTGKSRVRMLRAYWSQKRSNRESRTHYARQAGRDALGHAA